jgi:hypothetical protein
MQNLRKQLAALTVIALLTFGCAGISQRNLETFYVPDRPVIEPVPSGTTIGLPEDQFVDLTKYVVELEGVAEKCNAQAEVFNEAR